MSIKYRPEIDGLRTIAVFAVVLYHAKMVFNGIDPFKGGFIGVDVFFVISGYLITLILLRELNRGPIDFLYFYERRARRILPALFVVMLASTFFAWKFMLPPELKDYAGSMLSALGFGSNFWFWLEDSYIAEPSALKPLLHTWSLSVEEQFYVFFPIILGFLFKYGKKYFTTFLVIGLLLSLQLAQVGSTHFVDANFYLLPSRAWELLAGAILARLEIDRQGRSKHPFLKVTMPALGLFLICHAIIFFDDTMPHPSYMTAFPILGTMLLIWFCKEGELVTKILSSKPFVAIGLISYGFYLWHFPIFAFSRIKGSIPSNSKSLKYILLALLLATLSYFLIEKPLRNRQLVKRKPFTIGIVIAFLALVLLGGYTYVSIGSKVKNIEELPAYSEFKEPEFRRLKSEKPGKNIVTRQQTHTCTSRDPHEACHFGNGKFVTLGDSYIGHYENVLQKELAKRDQGLISLSAGQCPFVSPNIWFGNVPQCTQINQKRWEVIEQFKDKKIFLISADISQFERPKGMNGFKPASEDVIRSFQQNIQRLLEKGHSVVLISGPPTIDRKTIFKWKKELFSNLDKNTFQNRFHPNPKQYKKTKDKEIAFRFFEMEHPRLIKISVADLFCQGKQNQNCLLVTDEGCLYNNGSHLSSIGAKKVLEKVFSEISK